MAKKPNPRNPYAGTPSQRRVAEDIENRDRADIRAVEDRSPTRWSIGGRTLFVAPPKIKGGVNKFQVSAAKEAMDREDRRGVIQNSTYTDKTSKGFSKEEGDATRKRLIRKWDNEAQKFKTVKKGK